MRAFLPRIFFITPLICIQTYLEVSFLYYMEGKQTNEHTHSYKEVIPTTATRTSTITTKKPDKIK